MCGINGFVQFTNKLSEEQLTSTVNTMNSRIIHRGPDDNGIFSSKNVALGMRRLSIIDLATGNQPIFNEDKTKVIVFNGEIYNYKSIRKKLVNHKFSTNSDTEVVLHAYEEYGVDCLSHFDGMFAFAIYDKADNSVFIARDRAGEKPLYYTATNGIVAFASELKSLIAAGVVEKKINKYALTQYFQLTYIPAPLTIFEDVYKLPPAHYMLIDLRGDININKYWDVRFDQNNLIEDYTDCKQRLRKTVFNAVERCMVSDVPIGTFLSGGIDSTIITGLMSTISNTAINTFTIGYKNKDYDESDRARCVAKHYKTNHHIYTLDHLEALSAIDSITNDIDEPFADSSAIPTYIISKYARQYVKVVLTGDAGDELFGGYSKYLIGYYADRYNKIPSILRKNIFEKFIYLLPDKTSPIRKVRKVIESSHKDLFAQRVEMMCIGFKSYEIGNLLRPEYISDNSLDFIEKHYKFYEGETDEISKALYTDFHVVLEGDMLTKVDRMSMLNSIETRTPLLQRDVIELAAQIPSKYKINKDHLKIIFKDTFSDIIPQQLMNANKKGFGVPIDCWFREEMKEMLLATLNKELIMTQGIFNYNYIETILNEHMSGKRNRKSELWSLYIFQKWYLQNF